MSHTNGAPKNYNNLKAEEKLMDKSFDTFLALLAKGKITQFNLDDKDDVAKFDNLRYSFMAEINSWFNGLAWDFDGTDYAAGSIVLKDIPEPHDDTIKDLYCISFVFDQYEDRAALEPYNDEKTEILKEGFSGTHEQGINKLKELMKKAKIYKLKYS